MSEYPKPGRSSAMQRWLDMNAAMLSRKICQFELQPCRNRSGGPWLVPAGPVSSTLTRRPPVPADEVGWVSNSTGRCSTPQSTSSQVSSSPSAYVASGPGRRTPLRIAAAIRARAVATSRLPYQRAFGEYRDRHRLDAAPLLGPAVRRLAPPLRDRAALRRAVLLRRQGRPLQGDRHRRADRRLAGEPGGRDRGRDHRGDDPAPLEPRAVRDRGRDRRRRLGGARAPAGAGPGMTTTQPALPPATVSDDLRDHLPAIEPERTVSDWGRSERIEGLVDRTLYDFLYHYWFRCEVEGIENVPATGGALLVSNHAGALPPDAAMIAKAIKEEHPRPRRLHLTVEHFFKGYPFLSMLVAKIGGVPAHPANVHRLLHDEQQLVLVFPEGAKATEKLYKDRYKLRRFGRGGFVEAAMRARAPIVPIAVIGAEEAMPTFAHVGLLKRLTGLIYFPITPTFPHFGLLGMLGYLPAKFKIRFLEPFHFESEGLDEDKALVQTV